MLTQGLLQIKLTYPMCPKGLSVKRKRDFKGNKYQIDAFKSYI